MPILNLKKSRRVRDRVRLVTQRIRCFLFTPQYPDGIQGFAFVADLKDGLITAYTSASIKQGSDIQLAFEKKDAFAFKARALVCNRLLLQQGFFGTPAMNYIVAAQCSFSSELERKQYEKYVESLKDQILMREKAKEEQAVATPATPSETTSDAQVVAIITPAEKKAA